MENKIELNYYDLSFDEIWELMPSNFYKYCSINENLKENLSKNQLWFNTPASFNDPFDCKAYLNFGNSEKECLRNFEKFNDFFEVKNTEIQNKIWQDLLKKPDQFNTMMSASAAENFEEWLGVSCFSENYNNNLMWSHYADSHTGILLEFQKSKEGTLSRNLLPIQYFQEYPIINVSDYKKEEMISTAYQVICAKSNSWEYENEWRAIKIPGGKAFNFEKHELTGVVFGLKSKEEDQKVIQEILENTYPDISFQQAKLEEKKFKLSYKKL